MARSPIFAFLGRVPWLLEYRQRIAELEHGVRPRYRTWPGAPEVCIPSQLPANQQGSLFTDSPLPHTSPAPTSPNTQFFPGNCGVFPMTGRGLSAGNRSPGHDDRGHSDSAEALDAFFRAGVVSGGLIMVKYFFGCPRCKRLRPGGQGRKILGTRSARCERPHDHERTAFPQCNHSGRTSRNETVWHQSPRARPATMT